MKKNVILVITSVFSVAVIGIFHAREWPLYEWTRPLMIIPIIYAGINMRRAGSIFTAVVLVICQMPFIIHVFIADVGWGINYFVTDVAVCALGVYLGHVLRKVRKTVSELNETYEMMESIQKKTRSEELFDEMERQFKTYGQSEQVEIYLYDDNGKLRNRKSLGSQPLPEAHLFHKVAETGEYMASNSVLEDSRLEYYGPESEKDRVSRIAVFPIVYGGIRRGVIALANSADEHFAKETVSFLITIKQSIETFLELAEKRQTTIDHIVQRQKILDTFSSYLSKNVAEVVLKDPDKLELGGKLQDVTVMFTEVVNFQELLKTLDPADLIYMLNEYFSIAIDTVFEFDGTMDKFIGDNIMAFWGAPLPMPDGDVKAVQCAVRLQQKIRMLNESWESINKPVFEVSIGINTGKVVAGNIGSIRRMEYTVIGDTVNVASRIKSLSKTKHVPILVSESTHEKIKDSFRFEERFEASVKGKAAKITVFQLKP